LELSRIPFTAQPADIDEKATSKDWTDPQKITLNLAKAKALKISEGFPDDLVLGADQTLSFKGQVRGKPESPDQLKSWFREMGGKEHHLFTSQVLVKNGALIWSYTAATKLVLRPFDQIDFDDYIAKHWEDVRHCAGGYMFEVTPHIFSHVSGSVSDIMGLSVLELSEALKEISYLPSAWQPPKFAAVLGHPIAHSKSPRIHRYWLNQSAVAGDYLKIDIPPVFFEDTVNVLFQAGFSGFNVTIPHKGAALSVAGVTTDRASAIGASNTLYLNEKNEIVAENTDGLGFLAHLMQSVPTWQSLGKSVLVLGAGGAARAVVSAMVNDGAGSVKILNRTKDKADQIAAMYDHKVASGHWDDRSTEIAEADLIVNTTSLGMDKMPALEIDFRHASSGKVFYDLVYAPLETNFLSEARSRGCTCVDGLGMLLHQAAPGFAAWFDQMPVVDDKLRAVVLEQ